MSWYNEVKESAEDIKPGTYSATLTKANTKISKKGDNMIVLVFAAGSNYVNRYVVIRKDLAKMWIRELAHIGVNVTAAIADAEEQELSFDQFFWELHARSLERVGSTVEIAITYKPGEDLPNVSIRKLIAEPRGKLDTEPAEEQAADDGIPF